MAAKKTNTVQLGLFVMAGLGFLIMLLYVIGKNQNLFGNTFTLKVTFSNINGLLPGNNVRYAGIDAGSVKGLEVSNDSTIEVTLLIKTKMKPFIKRNARIRIGTDGLIGNRVVNIEPAHAPAPVVNEDDVLCGENEITTDDMLRTLGNTTNDVALIATELKHTLQRINGSKAIWRLLDDPSLPAGIQQSVKTVDMATTHLSQTMLDLSVVMRDIKNGRGTVGKLLRDSSVLQTAEEAVAKFKNIGSRADSLLLQVNQLAASLSKDVESGKGTVNVLLKDEKMAQHLGNTIRNIEQDTQALNEVLEALKNSFLLRGYFKKLAKQKQKITSVQDR